MDAERFDRIKRILVSLEGLPAADRPGFLDRECAGDVALRAEVESLMHDDIPSIMRTGGLAARLEPMIAADRVTLGRQIGPYRLLEVLGEGGMGVVYRAEQTSPIHREVALKLVPPGIDTARVLARFESERQALALMNHPYIAQALEAGAGDDGRPYVVMELVRGEPITEYCARERPPLGVRLKLFLQICEAIQHAHQRGIIHRDLKPSNVLLTTQGEDRVPKVIDFGIAKAMREDEGRDFLTTVDGQILGTPEYMSPEQAGLIDAGLDTRTDVYSLGIMLYELVSGRRPYELQRRSVTELDRVLRTPPPPPSLVAQAGRRGARTPAMRDIDAVTLMAIERLPDDRYASVEQLADDVRRVLEHRTVRARTQTWSYRTGRFVRRNAASVATVALVTALIVAGAVATVGQRNRALASEARALSEAARARAEADKASAVARFLTELFRESDPANARGASVSARDLLDRGAARLSTELASQDAVRATLMDTIGVVYRMLGMRDEAESITTAALAVHRRVSGGGSADIAQSLDNLGHLALDRSRYDEAEKLHRDALALRRRFLGPKEPAVAESLTSLGVALRELARYDEAVPLVEEAIAIRREALGPEHSDTLTSLKVLASIRDNEGSFSQAERLYGEVLATRRRLLPADHPLVAESMDDLAGVVSREGRLAEAEAMFRDALAVRRKILDADHPDLTTTMVNLSRTLRNLGRLDESESMLRDALAADRRRGGNMQMRVAVDLNYLATLLEDRGRLDEAARHYEESMQIRIALVGEVHPLVAVILHNYGRLKVRQRAYDEAERSFRRAIEIRTRLGQATHRSTGGHILQLGRLAEQRGRLDEAAGHFAASLAIQRAISPGGSASTCDTLESLGYLLVRQKKAAEGEPLIREALAFRRKTLPPGHRTILLDEADLAEGLIQQAKWAEAEKLLTSTLTALPAATPHAGLRARVIELLAELYDKTGRPDEAAKQRAQLDEGVRPRTPGV